MKWISSAQLEQWADTRSSRADLPAMVGDLIRATATDIASFRFPNGEKSEVRGFDGNLLSLSEGLNVPEGPSIWEFGTESNYNSKATKDFQKRSSQVSAADRATTTFVFVTPYTWDSSKSTNKVEDWIAERRTESDWKDIRYIDGVGLEVWLDACPAVAAWHAKYTVKCMPPDGVRSTDEFWNEFSNRYEPPLSEEVLLCEREEARTKLLDAMLGGPGIMKLVADSLDEVIAFAVASIRKAKPEVRRFLEARTLVIDTLASGRLLLAENRLIYFLLNDASRSPRIFSDFGPVLVPIGRRQLGSHDIVLERPTSSGMAQAMETMGLPETRALTLAKGCGRSLTALARQIPAGQCEDPPWMAEAEMILPAVFAGAWDEENELDRNVIRELSRSGDYFDYARRIRKFSKNFDPPLDLERFSL